MSLGVGDIVGDYRIVAVIGVGGSGEVFRVEHTITRQAEAMKALSSGRYHPLDEEERFLREIQLQASLHHPNIASVHNAFFASGGLALVMELVEGESLDAILERGRIPLPVAVNYALQVLEALRHAHARSILHRDVKPGNILITPSGVVKLTDFGLARATKSARLTQSGELAGSPYYMSPEQISDAKLDGRTDLYSLGVVLYEMATGRRPFPGDNSFEVMRAHVERQPVPPMDLDPAIGPDLNCVILTAMAKDPGERFQSAAKFQQALEAARQSLLSSPAGARRKRLPGVPLSRTARIAILTGVGVCSLILAGVVATGDRARAPAAPPPAAVAAPAPAPAAIQPAPVAPAEAAEESATTLPRKRVRRARELVILGVATPKPEPPPHVAPGPPKRDAELPVPTVEPPPPPSSETPRTKIERIEPPPAPAPKKRGNRVLRTLGKIVQPWKAGDDKQKASSSPE
jgi:hypothetical protein